MALPPSSLISSTHVPRLQLAGNYYPERLGHFFILSPPTAFHTLWKAVYRFIDPVTREKVRTEWGRWLLCVSLMWDG